jgi:hypothetical protein
LVFAREVFIQQFREAIPRDERRIHLLWLLRHKFLLRFDDAWREFAIGIRDDFRNFKQR